MIESLEARQLLSTLPSGFSESTVAHINTSKAATMAFTPDGRLYVSDSNTGQIRLIKNNVLQATAALTLSVDHYRERGINGIAFAPDFATAAADKKYVYVYYTTPDPLNPNTSPNNAKNRLSRFAMSTTSPDQIDKSSEKVLLDGIPSDPGNHNGGTLKFGADKMLYLAIGDNGDGNNSQNLSNLNGKVLRLNVANPDNLVPADNPFVATAGARGEIWALGLRNPFTGDFKPGTNTFYINDVGSSLWEEINDIQKGKNYGWPIVEGTGSNPAYTNPIYKYQHTTAVAITGAAWYESSQFPSTYKDKYFFGDYILKTIRYLNPTTHAATTFATNTLAVVDIDVNPKDGTLWYLDVNGSVERIRFNAASKTLRATADAYVRDGSSANSNFGLTTDLQVKKSTAGFNRESYLKFDLTGVTSVASAKLRLFGKLSSTEAKNIIIALFGVSNTTWTETGIKYSNKPPSGTTALAKATIIDTTSRFYEFDVTTYVKANLGKVISFALKGTVNALPTAVFNSDENVSNKPQLVITSATASAPAGELSQPTFDAAAKRELLDLLA